MRKNDKIQVLAESAKFDLCCSNRCLGSARTNVGRKRGAAGQWIYPATMPDGRTILLFKVLLSNDCHNDCAYCATRCSSGHQRATFEEEELARLFLELRRRGLAEGMFLSSGIWRSANETMDRMLVTADLLRGKYQFDGFLHLKVIPGASLDRVERAAQLADRISINLEAPNSDALSQISPNKDFDLDLIRRMQWIGALIDRSDTRAKGHTTQFIVGAANETDRDILGTTTRLYDRFGLSRAYFSAFQPIEGSPLTDKPSTPPMREHRLYQCDYLFRKYDFALDELLFGEDGDLTLDENPKKVWADAHPEIFPIEINQASKSQLLRVPGIGPRAAGRILRARRKGKLHTVEELRGTGCVTKWAAPYVTIDGKLGAPRPAKQLVLW